MQVALSLVLLMGAALFVRSLHNMFAQDLGYDHDHLLMVRVDPVSAGYKGASVTVLYQQIREKLRAVSIGPMQVVHEDHQRVLR